MAIRRTSPRPVLDASIVAVALGGWGQPEPEDTVNSWAPHFDVHRDRWGALWVQHRAFLEAEAVKRGIPKYYRGPDGVMRHFAESEAWEDATGQRLVHVDVRYDEDDEDGADA